MTTLAQAWVDRTRKYLHSGYQPEANQLSASYTAGGTSLSFKYPLGGITKGCRLHIGLNTFRVWDVSSTSNTATVQGGWEGTTDASAASGTTVYVRPLFTDDELFTALNEELLGLSAPQSGLYQMKTFDITYVPQIDGYDLTAVTDLQSIYEVRYQEPGPGKDWPRIESWHYRLDRNALAADFPSGSALKIMATAWSGFDVRLVYKAPYSTLTTLASDVATTGVSAQAADLPPLGAAIRLVAGREIKRNFTETQPDTRRAGEVPAGAVLNSSRGLMMKYQQRIAEEASRLSAQYPPLRA